ncbi:DNA-binding protein [Hymenobacter sp. ASUV-10]|uniref:DNA-binding protein n=1 Tax=Hymenobacter aranciens TaxID=3063996 RepID=A0ABT9B859_9BACT|nr:PPC domain-containing DNA-binding protein [Hymenobacter sp. ASUV-10]MDO7874456.1 DNA-binding protein [Hymenobacter sp. ASUV-10]
MSQLLSLLTTAALLGTAVSAVAQPTATAPAKYIRTPTGYLLVLRPGDNVLRELEELTVKEKIPGASLTGLGFGHPTFGFWNAQTKTYAPQAFRDMEMASLTGSIAWKDGKPALHLHGVAAGQDFAAHGGHLLALEVGTGSVEITVTLHDQRLTRETDAQTGANVLTLPR